MITYIIGAALIVLVLVAGGASRLLALPLILVACPLMMFIMMRRMNHQHVCNARDS